MNYRLDKLATMYAHLGKSARSVEKGNAKIFGNRNGLGETAVREEVRIREIISLPADYTVPVLIINNLK